MALRKFLILRKLRSSCLEGPTALIQLIVMNRPSMRSTAMGSTILESIRVRRIYQPCTMGSSGYPERGAGWYLFQ